MPNLEDVLHDSLDDQEALAERARLAVEAVKARLVDIFNKTDDKEEALAAIVAVVADELTDITTDAVHAGREFGHRLMSAS